jgi:mercuric reductase
LERALQSVPGVESATVSYATRRGTVIASDEVNTAELLRVVEQAGYRAEIVTEAGTTTAPTERVAKPTSGEPSKADSSGSFDYDLLIIGTGAAGMSAAIRASELGRSAAIVEGAEVGGTCVNVGCVPSKNLLEAANHYHVARTGFPGIAPCEPQLSWSGVLRQKRELIEGLRKEKYLDVLAAYDKVTLLRGRAALLGGGRVRVDGREYRVRKIVLATGTLPSMPPIPGLAEAGALDSTTAMELERLPESMIVLGGGSTGLELGQAFSRFGVRVIIAEALERILPNEDAEIAEVLTRSLEAEGIEIHTGVRATKLERTERGYRVAVEEGSLRGVLEAEQLLVATGRRPNTEGLGLDAAGVKTDRRGFIQVDEFMRTSNPDVFAAGDVTGGPAFVYVAALEGGIAAQAALAELTGEKPIPVDLATVPRVTFTDPQVASVGMREDEARNAGLSPQATSLPARHLARAAVSHRPQGVIRLVSEVGTDRLLGAHAVLPNGGDIISEATLAIRFGLTTRDVVSTLHPYLTWGEGLKLAAQTFTKDVAKLSCCA